jgi:hypothetical protein
MTAIITILNSLTHRAFRVRLQKCHFATLKADFAEFDSRPMALLSATVPCESVVRVTLQLPQQLHYCALTFTCFSLCATQLSTF